MVSRKRCDASRSAGSALESANSVGLSEAMRRTRAWRSRPPLSSANSVGLSEAMRPDARPKQEPTLASANSVGLSEAMRRYRRAADLVEPVCQQRWSLGSDATSPRRRTRRPIRRANSVGLSEAMRLVAQVRLIRGNVVPTALVSRKRCDRRSFTVTTTACCANSVGLSEAMRPLAITTYTAGFSGANSVGLSEAMRQHLQGLWCC